jgi:benzoyl-CoA reductase/2-hydroxyglutaryl-CoA dehydratase subunit BcrC/BadD/HgdB
VCAKENKTFSRLFEYYSDREKATREFRRNGGKVVGQMGCDVPDELVIAAGMFPYRIYAGDCKQLVEADKYLEYSFDPVVRNQFEKIVDGSLSKVTDFLAISNSTDTLIRIFLYLRELKREEPEKQIPPFDFIDWLFTRRLVHQTRNEFTISLFWKTLEEWSGKKISESDYHAAAAICNEDRAALREIMKLRHADKPRISGTEALVIICSAFFMDRQEHASLVRKLAEDAKNWPEIDGERVFVTGSNQENTELYELIEKTGAVVVGEDNDWGERFFERDCDLSYSPVRSLVDRYMLRGFSSKKALVSQRVESLDKSVSACGANGVIFYLNSFEEAASWDLPSQRKSLASRGIVTRAFTKMSYPASKNSVIEPGLKTFIESLKGRMPT